MLFVVLCAAGCGGNTEVTTGSTGVPGCTNDGDCNNGDPCTLHICKADGTCTHPPNGTCNTGGSAGNGGAAGTSSGTAGSVGGSGGSAGNTGGMGGTGGGPVTCNDGVCTDVLAGQCFISYTCSAGGLCKGVDKISGEDDGDACTKDICQDDAWTHSPFTAEEISDEDPCTVDSCSSAVGITHEAIQGCACMMTPVYAGMVSGVVSQWGANPQANGKTGYEAGVEICKTIGADHPCEYMEVKAAEAMGALVNVAQGTTAWLHRTTPGPNAEPAGPGGRCNDWTYATNHIADGEYITFDVLGVPTYHIDNDTFYDGIDTTHQIQGDLQCGGEVRNIMCCFPKCIP